MLDRRLEARAISTFKSAYLRSKAGLHFVTLRNISASGICLDACPDLAEGDLVEYCFDGNAPRTGIVRWVDAGRCGVSADDVATPDADTTRCLPARTVRLPLSCSARLFVDGRPHDVVVHNLSIRGTCIGGFGKLVPGQLVSIAIGNRTFALASVRWTEQDLAGIRFDTPVHPAEFRDLVAKLQQPAPRPDAGCAAANQNAIEIPASAA